MPIKPPDSANTATTMVLAQTPQGLRNMKITPPDFRLFRTQHGVNPESLMRSLTQTHKKSNSLPNNWA
jgi:hypothetical protein